MGRFKFSLRILLAAVGIGAALWVAEPSWQVGAIEGVLLVIIPVLTIRFARRSRGKARAWWEGVGMACLCSILIFFYLYSVRMHAPFAEAPITSPVASSTTFLANLSARFRFIIAFWAFAPAVGVFFIVMHRLIGPPPGRYQP